MFYRTLLPQNRVERGDIDNPEAVAGRTAAGIAEVVADTVVAAAAVVGIAEAVAAVLDTAEVEVLAAAPVQMTAPQVALLAQAGVSAAAAVRYLEPLRRTGCRSLRLLHPYRIVDKTSYNPLP